MRDRVHWLKVSMFSIRLCVLVSHSDVLCAYALSMMVLMTFQWLSFIVETECPSCATGVPLVSVSIGVGLREVLPTAILNIQVGLGAHLKYIISATRFVAEVNEGSRKANGARKGRLSDAAMDE